MAKSNAERQADYRRRMKDTGEGRRLNLVVDSETDDTLEKLAVQYGVSKTEALRIAMEVVSKDEVEAQTRSKATGKKYRSTFERQLAERSDT